jgi:hypothetical protein
MLGPEEGRNEKLGFPSPLLLKLHPSSTYTDTRALAAQARASRRSSITPFVAATDRKERLSSCSVANPA